MSSKEDLVGLYLYQCGHEFNYKEEKSSNIKTKWQNKMKLFPEEKVKVSIIFSLKDEVGSLERAIEIFDDLKINIQNMKPKSRDQKACEDVFIHIECEPKQLQQLYQLLKKEVVTMVIGKFSVENMQDKSPVPRPLFTMCSYDSDDVPWFPKTISDLDLAQNVLMYGIELDADHPSFNDIVYRDRREEFYSIAMDFQYGDPIPQPNYTREEIQTWGTIFRELQKLHRKHACKEYLKGWNQLVKYCRYRDDHIPRLRDVNTFLKKKTGFILRPAAGYMKERDFLAELAFRVFPCTQYIRHSKEPFYNPEPDYCHELIGHVPLLLNLSFAQFCQEIGLASLGASDEDIKKLARLYFSIFEFGFVKQDCELKVIGAGLLSSVAELKRAVYPKTKKRSFNAELICNQEHIITNYQLEYWYTNSFEDAKEQLRTFAEQIKRPFCLQYDPLTHSVDVLDKKKGIMDLVTELNGDVLAVYNVLQQISFRDHTQDVNRIASALERRLINKYDIVTRL